MAVHKGTPDLRPAFRAAAEAAQIFSCADLGILASEDEQPSRAEREDR
jgi:hypothetical protein